MYVYVGIRMRNHLHSRTVFFPPSPAAGDPHEVWKTCSWLGQRHWYIEIVLICFDDTLIILVTCIHWSVDDSRACARCSAYMWFIFFGQSPHICWLSIPRPSMNAHFRLVNPPSLINFAGEIHQIKFCRFSVHICIYICRFMLLSPNSSCFSLVNELNESPFCSKWSSHIVPSKVWSPGQVRLEGREMWRLGKSP